MVYSPKSNTISEHKHQKVKLKVAKHGSYEIL
jgi:hypothetical protein